MPEKDLRLILDDCLDRLNRGETLDSCLSAYPEHASELRPMLASVKKTADATSFSPDRSTKARARAQFIKVMTEKPSKPARTWLSRLGYWPFAVATAVTVVVLALVGYTASQPGISPIVPVPSPQGNFVFQISDAVNAIADFSSLDVTIEKIGVLDGDGWIEFAPETPTVDLVQLPGDISQAIWRGDLPEGDYSKVYIYVSSVQGILKSTGQSVDVKLPGNKLQINHNFKVSASGITSFTFDLTVKANGNPKHGLKYQLSPQVDESGASTSPR
jgi:Domain of unknown function (DUF4382)